MQPMLTNPLTSNVLVRKGDRLQITTTRHFWVLETTSLSIYRLLDSYKIVIKSGVRLSKNALHCNKPQKHADSLRMRNQVIA